MRILGTDYRDYFFFDTAFNEEALRPEVYLIVGRRGAGKTALSQFLSFQSSIRDARAVDIDEPSVYQEVLAKVSTFASSTDEIAIPRLAKIWDFVIWSVLFRELKDESKSIADACLFGTDSSTVSKFIRHIFRSLLQWFNKDDNLTLAEDLEDWLEDGVIEEAKRAVLELASRRPMIIAFDTLENYAVHDQAIVRAISALIEAAANFNSSYSRRGLHLKLFVMAEVFPFLCEDGVMNTSKVVRDEVYLHWRPKDLMRLIGWRFSRYLDAHGIALPLGSVANWNDHNEVREKTWDCFFGSELKNGRGLSEKSFPYVMRHTQLRPRQLIMLCNSIAKRARDARTFPTFDAESIRRGIMSQEQKLATEVMNAYSSVYPKVGDIVAALTGAPMILRGSELDKRAHETASEWPAGEYSPLHFRKLLAELGVVGRIRSHDRVSGVIEADFEYNLSERLNIMTEDQCVIHPMFYEKLHIERGAGVRVYPFPDHEDFRDLGHV